MKKLLLVLPLLFTWACHDDEERTVVRPPVEVMPAAVCCDFYNRHDCREFPGMLIQKPGFQKKQAVCFKDDACLTRCP